MVKHLWLIPLLTLVFLPIVFTTMVPKDDALKIMRGFCDGLDLDGDIHESGFVEGDDIADSITLLSTEGRKYALKGLKKLGSALGELPELLTNKGGNKGSDNLYLTKIQSFATNLEGINAYAPQDNNNVTIDGVSILDLVNKATNALNAGDHYNAGLAMGMALGNVFTATQPPMSEDVAAEVAEKAEAAGWETGEVPEFAAKYTNLDDMSKHIMGIPEDVHREAVNEQRRRRRLGIEAPAIYARASYPPNFDPRTDPKMKNCIGPVRNQGTCGSCWTYSGTGALSDRVCIASKGKTNKMLSTQYVLECDNRRNGGCQGGVPMYEYEYIKQNGVFQESCFPYASGARGQLLGRCPSQCKDGSVPNKIYVTGSKRLQNENDIKYELMNNGPVSTTITVYQDFMSYKGGIFSHVSGGKGGGHAIKLIGWGTDQRSGSQFWICQNSWGTGWGEGGYFRIRFGDSDVNSQCDAPTPDLQRSVVDKKNGEDMPKESNGGNTGGAEFGGGDDDGGGGGGGGDEGYDDGGNGGYDDGGNGGYDDGGNGGYDDGGNGGYDDGGNGGYDDGGNGGYDDGGYDNSGNGGGGGYDDYDNGGGGGYDDYRRNEKSKGGVRKNSPRTTAKKATAESAIPAKKAPIRRRRTQSQRRSPTPMSKIVRDAAAKMTKTASVHKVGFTQKQVHRLRQP